MTSNPWIEDIALDLSESVEILEANCERDILAINRRYEVYRRHKAGHSVEDIADHCGFHYSSINRILYEMIYKIRTKYKLHLSAKYMAAVCDNLKVGK